MTYLALVNAFCDCFQSRSIARDFVCSVHLFNGFDFVFGGIFVIYNLLNNVLCMLMYKNFKREKNPKSMIDLAVDRSHSCGVADCYKK